MFKSLLAAVFVILASQPALSQSGFSDRDWNVKALSNCSLPKAMNGQKPVFWTRVENDRKLVFVLQPGQVGGCSTDNMKRHGAPYWERAEVRQRGFLDFSRQQVISFEATFLSGFSGSRETFFQIHGWNDGCPAYPPLMLHVDRGVIHVRALSGVKPNAGREWLSKDQGSHRSVQKRSLRVASLMGKPQKFEIIFTPATRSAGRLAVRVNGQSLVDDAPIEFAPCAKPHIKFGIYRPGGTGTTSSIAFDDVKTGG